MKNTNKVIDTAKKLIALPYNQFNLENYYQVLMGHGIRIARKDTSEYQPIRLMSGNNFYSGIAISPYFNVDKRHIYVVGKGILFDSGGYDLKKGMADMKNDKAGMISALAVAQLLPKKVTAWCPVTTNFIHNSKIIPGDEIKVGLKTIKVTNTDAEGRLILAEAINEINASPNDIIITVATLTGAVGNAIDKKATGVFTLNDDLACKFAVASKEADELQWRLPMWDYLQKKYYSNNRIDNATKGIQAGATEGALFLRQFVRYPQNWIHLDIAYSAFTDKEKPSGVPIKSLVNFINKL